MSIFINTVISIVHNSYILFWFVFVLEDMQLSTAELTNLTLIEIENMMQSNRRSLREFKDMPFPDLYITRHVGNRLIFDERDYDADLERQNFQNLFSSLTCISSLFKSSMFSLNYCCIDSFHLNVKMSNVQSLKP